MANQTDVLIAVAIAGITAGVNDERDFSQIDAGSLADSTAQTAAILAAAEAVDAAVGFEALLATSDVNPTILITALGKTGSKAGTIPFFSYTLLLGLLCESAFSGKGDISDMTQAEFAAIANGINAQFVATIAQMPTS